MFGNNYLAGRDHKPNIINKAFKKLTNSTREATRSKKGNRVKNVTSPCLYDVFIYRIHKSNIARSCS